MPNIIIHSDFIRVTNAVADRLRRRLNGQVNYELIVSRV